MKISNVAFNNSYFKPAFRGYTLKTENKKTGSDSLNVELPDSTQYDYAPLYTDPKKGRMLETTYRNKLMGICFDEEGKLNPIIKNKLDDSNFIFEQPDGTSKVMTIKDALKSYVISSKPFNGQLIHATFVREDAENIKKHGFDPKRISRAEFGPGFYFTPSEGEAMNYGSAMLSARVKGNCAHMDGKFYEKIKTQGVTDTVKNFIGLKSSNHPTFDIERQVVSTVINEYVRNILFEELGYDCAYGAGGGKSCFVVYNPDAISDIKVF